MRSRLHFAAILILSLCLSVPLEALTVYRFGSEGLPAPQMESAYDLVQIRWDELDAKSHGAQSGILMAQESIAPIRFSPDTNLTPLMGTWGGEVRFYDSGYRSFAPLPAVGEELFVADGDPETAFLGKPHLWWAVAAFWILDFDVPIPVERIRITTRKRFASERFLQWFEIYGSVHSDQFKKYPHIGEAELIYATTENIDAIFEITLPSTPIHELGLWVRPPAFKPWEISEIEVYSSGFIPAARYRTNVLDLGSVANVGAIDWSGEIGLGANIEVRVRTGDDDDPSTYHRRTFRGDEQVTLGSNGETLDRESYNEMGLKQRGSITYDTVNWTSWRGPLDSTDAAAAIASPPRRYAQFDVTLRSTLDGSGQLDYLQFAASPALATSLVAEIEPNVAAAATATTFNFKFSPRLEPGDLGFDTIAIDTPARPLAVKAVSVGATATDFALVRLDDTGFTVRLPTHIDVARTMELIEIEFSAEVFEYGTLFAGRVYDSSRPAELPQPIIPGDAHELYDSNGLRVALADIPDRAIHAFRLSSAVFTPNGDRVNDQLRIEYELLNLKGGTPFTLAVYDLAGQRVVVIDAAQVDNGRHHVDWDGTDDNGLRVPPGIFLVEGSLETDAGNEGARRAVAVIY